MRGWLVEHQHRRGCEQRAGQHDPLPLAAGKFAALLPDEGVEPVWTPGYPVPDPSAPQRLLDLSIAGARATRNASPIVTGTKKK